MNIKTCRNCIKTRQHDQVQKDVKIIQKFDFWMEPKMKTLLSTCFYIIAVHSVCYFSLPVWRRSFWRRGPSVTFLTRPGSTPGRIWPKDNNTCKGPWVLHAYQVSSKSIKRFWRSYLTDRRRTDVRRRTTDNTWSKATSQQRRQKSITLWLWTDLGRSFGETTVIQLVWFTGYF